MSRGGCCYESENDYAHALRILYDMTLQHGKHDVLR